MRGAALVAHLGIAFAVAACGKELEVDAPADAASRDDATSADGGALVDTGASASLHPNGTFEVSCAPWEAFQGDATHVTADARTGTGACRFCTDGSGTYFTADDGGSFGAPEVGAEYQVEAWVRSVDGKAVPPRVTVAVRTRDAERTQIENGAGTLATPLSPTWQRMTAKLLVTKPANQLAVVVGADRSSNECFLLDDVVLVRTK